MNKRMNKRMNKKENTTEEHDKKKQKVTKDEEKQEYFTKVREQYLKEVFLTIIGKYHLFQYKSYQVAIEVIEKYEKAIQNDLIFSLIKSVCFFHLGDYKKCINIIDSIRASNVQTKDDSFAQKVANLFYMDTNVWNTVQKVPMDSLYPVNLMLFKIFGLAFDFSIDTSTLSISNFLKETQKSLKYYVLMREDLYNRSDEYREYFCEEDYSEEEEEEGYVPFVENNFEYLKQNFSDFDENKFQDYFEKLDKDTLYYDGWRGKYISDDESDDEVEDKKRQHKKDFHYLENFEFVAQKDKIFLQEPHEIDSEGEDQYSTPDEEYSSSDDDSSEESVSVRFSDDFLIRKNLERVKKETYLIFTIFDSFDLNTEDVKTLIDIFPPIFMDYCKYNSGVNFDELIVHALNINCGLIGLLPQNMKEKYFMTAYKLNKKIVHLFTSKELLEYKNAIDDYEIPKVLNFWNVKFYFF
jgi:hypothetical protein